MKENTLSFDLNLALYKKTLLVALCALVFVLSGCGSSDKSSSSDVWGNKPVKTVSFYNYYGENATCLAYTNAKTKNSEGRSISQLSRIDAYTSKLGQYSSCSSSAPEENIFLSGEYTYSNMGVDGTGTLSSYGIDEYTVKIKTDSRSKTTDVIDFSSKEQLMRLTERFDANGVSRVDMSIGTGYNTQSIRVNRQNKVNPNSIPNGVLFDIGEDYDANRLRQFNINVSGQGYFTISEIPNFVLLDGLIFPIEDFELCGSVNCNYDLYFKVSNSGTVESGALTEFGDIVMCYENLGSQIVAYNPNRYGECESFYRSDEWPLYSVGF